MDLQRIREKYNFNGPLKHKFSQWNLWSSSVNVLQFARICTVLDVYFQLLSVSCLRSTVSPSVHLPVCLCLSLSLSEALSLSLSHANIKAIKCPPARKYCEDLQLRSRKCAYQDEQNCQAIWFSVYYRKREGSVPSGASSGPMTPLVDVRHKVMRDILQG